MPPNMASIFQVALEAMTADQESREVIRVVVRDIEQTSRELLAVLQEIHQVDGVKRLAIICEQAYQYFEKVRELYGALKLKVPADQFYRFHDHWRAATQRLVFLAALTIYLETDTLATREQVCDLLGVAVERGVFHLDLEDYLSGLLHMTSELSRFAVNSVTAGDYDRPLQILKFMKELNSGFHLLNLKNDHLRRRYDGLKYDLKKVEDVVYDLAIRGLKHGEVEIEKEAEIEKEVESGSGEGLASTEKELPVDEGETEKELPGDPA